MAKLPPVTPLRVISAGELTPPAPPSTLGAAGAALWREMVSAYRFDDVGGQAVLAQACRHLDVAEALREGIEQMGAVGTTEGGALRVNPAVQAEVTARNSVARLIRQLGVNDAPRRDKPGRPPKSEGWQAWRR
jgi:phage terminase small subunit